MLRHRAPARPPADAGRGRAAVRRVAPCPAAAACAGRRPRRLVPPPGPCPLGERERSAGGAANPARRGASVGCPRELACLLNAFAGQRRPSPLVPPRRHGARAEQVRRGPCLLSNILSMRRARRVPRRPPAALLGPQKPTDRPRRRAAGRAHGSRTPRGGRPAETHHSKTHGRENGTGLNGALRAAPPGGAARAGVLLDPGRQPAPGGLRPIWAGGRPAAGRLRARRLAAARGRGHRGVGGFGAPGGARVWGRAGAAFFLVLRRACGRGLGAAAARHGARGRAVFSLDAAFEGRRQKNGVRGPQAMKERLYVFPLRGWGLAGAAPRA